MCLKGILRQNDTVMLGPDITGSFSLIRVKSIHRKRMPVVEVHAGHSASCWLHKVKWTSVRKGMMLLSPSVEPNVCWEFEAEVLVLHHPTTIGVRYQAMLHCGSVRQTVKIVEMSKDFMRTGDKAQVRFRFLKNPEYLCPGQRLIFREGRTKAVGTIIKTFGKLSTSNTKTRHCTFQNQKFKKLSTLISLGKARNNFRKFNLTQPLLEDFVCVKLSDVHISLFTMIFISTPESDQCSGRKPQINYGKHLKLQVAPDRLSLHCMNNLEGGYASHIWPCADVLASYICAHQELVFNKRVLELGSGPGLVSLTAARCGASYVTISDRFGIHSMDRMVEQNCAMNCLADHCAYTSLTWGRVSANLVALPPYDVIFLSDCFYDPSVFDSIQFTVAFLLSRNYEAIVYFSYKERRYAQFLKTLISIAVMTSHEVYNNFPEHFSPYDEPSCCLHFSAVLLYCLRMSRIRAFINYLIHHYGKRCFSSFVLAYPFRGQMQPCIPTRNATFPL
ncbi:elongation factor Tu protein [Trichuris suis]|nr:elongation factor Tu protein [Trichuris suis]